VARSPGSISTTSRRRGDPFWSEGAGGLEAGLPDVEFTCRPGPDGRGEIGDLRAMLEAERVFPEIDIAVHRWDIALKRRRWVGVLERFEELALGAATTDPLFAAHPASGSRRGRRAR